MILSRHARAGHPRNREAVLQFVDSRDEPGHDDTMNRLSEAKH